MSVESKSKLNQNEAYINSTKHVADLFTAKRNSDGSTFFPSSILVEGAPGIGKTMLSKEIAYQWASNNILHSKTLLFLSFLQNFKSSNVSSLETFLEHI